MSVATRATRSTQKRKFSKASRAGPATMNGGPPLASITAPIVAMFVSFNYILGWLFFRGLDPKQCGRLMRESWSSVLRLVFVDGVRGGVVATVVLGGIYIRPGSWGVSEARSPAVWAAVGVASFFIGIKPPRIFGEGAAQVVNNRETGARDKAVQDQVDLLYDPGSKIVGAWRITAARVIVRAAAKQVSRGLALKIARTTGKEAQIIAAGVGLEELTTATAEVHSFLDNMVGEMSGEVITDIREYLDTIRLGVADQRDHPQSPDEEYCKVTFEGLLDKLRRHNEYDLVMQLLETSELARGTP